MKKILALCAALALSVIMVVPAAAAPPTSNKGTITTIPYSVSYIDKLFGPVTCAGIHQYGNQWPGTPATGGQDTFICTSTSGNALMGLTPGESMTLATFVPYGGWISDYFFSRNGRTIYATSFMGTVSPFTGSVSPDGFSYTAVAGYY